MRLEPEETVAFKAAALRTFGDEVKIYLYGSGADDSKCGGDIDLLLESGMRRRPAGTAKVVFAAIWKA